MSILETGLAQVQRDLDALPEGSKGAFVTTMNSKGVITVALVMKTVGGWNVGAGLEAKLKKQIPDAYVGLSKVW